MPELAKQVWKKDECNLQTSLSDRWKTAVALDL